MPDFIEIRQDGNFSGTRAFFQANGDAVNVRQQAFGQNVTGRPEDPGRVTVNQEDLMGVKENMLGIVG